MPRPARLIGINHVALEVGDVDEALDFYGRLFAFELRGRVPGMAFVDMGDQFLALAECRTQPGDDGRVGAGAIISIGSAPLLGDYRGHRSPCNPGLP